MSDLWANQRALNLRAAAPLAVRMRPGKIEDVAGQEHILGEGKLLWRMLRADAMTSLIFHGPPGTGKTTLAELIARYTKRHFIEQNAAAVGVKRIREISQEATQRLEISGRRTILFLDEIHRFSKSQQDVLLEDVEKGVLTLIGATTENPLFACNAALVSRSTLFRLEPLSIDEVVGVLKRAIADEKDGYGSLSLQVSDEALRLWAIKCDGDARRALSALEIAVLSTPVSEQEQGENYTIEIDIEAARQSIQQKAAVYAGAGDEHYDTISAMIKSVRGSDPDAAVYWIARMIDAGEDPRFIARRLAILASEDIGNADPRSMLIAQAAWELVERIGLPEARITLSQAAIYLAMAPKSNASYMAIERALDDVRSGRTVPVPVHLKDKNASPPSPGGNKPGAGYQYAHANAGAIGLQDYLGVDRVYYEPTDQGLEVHIGERLREIRKLRQAYKEDVKQ